MLISLQEQNGHHFKTLIFRTKARFKCRTLPVPNLIIRFGTCEVRRMNQLGTALLYLGRLCCSLQLSLSNRMAKDRLRFIRRTSHVPNLMHKLC